MIATVEVERFSLTSSRPFNNILAAIKTALGHPQAKLEDCPGHAAGRLGHRARPAAVAEAGTGQSGGQCGRLWRQCAGATALAQGFDVFAQDRKRIAVPLNKHRLGGTA